MLRAWRLRGPVGLCQRDLRALQRATGLGSGLTEPTKRTKFTSQYLGQQNKPGVGSILSGSGSAPLQRKKARYEDFATVDRFGKDPNEDAYLDFEDAPIQGEVVTVDMGGPTATRGQQRSPAARQPPNGSFRSSRQQHGNSPQQGGARSAPRAAYGGTRSQYARKAPVEKPVEVMRGTVGRVIFHNDKTGWSVLSVKMGKPKGKEDEVECFVGMAGANRVPNPLIVTGVMPDPQTGEHVEIRGGTWEASAEHGKQFKADKLLAVKPETKEELVKYLSRFFPGVGPAKAKKIVAHFQLGVFDTLEKTPEKFKEVPGINDAMIDGLVETYYERVVAKNVLQFLMQNGVSGKLAHIVWKKYKGDAIAKIKANPYILVTEFRYFAFRLADTLAQRLNIALDSHQRICAGVHYALHVSEQYGHCGMPMWRVVDQAAELLDLPQAKVAKAVEEELLDPDGTVVSPTDLEQESAVDKEVNRSRRLVFTRRSYNMEKSVARGFADLINCPDHPLAKHAEQEDQSDLLADVDMDYHSPSQQNAIRKAISEKVLIITGGPGVGKTRTIKTILGIYEKKEMRCLLCAPTGRAAIRLQEVVEATTPASTIHRLLESNPRGTSFSKNAENKLECDLLIVDEVSMVDLPLMHALIQALPQECSLLLVGDADQLPSVGPGQVLRDVIKSETVQVAHLTEVFRQQQQSNIIRAAHTINANEVPNLTHQLPKLAEIAAAGDKKLDYSDFCFVECNTPKHAVLPKLGFNELDVQVLTPMTVYELGSKQLNKKLQEQLNPRAADKKEHETAKILFREGDRVMQIQNNYDKNVFNGEVGKLMGVEKDEDGKPLLRVRMDRVEEDLLYTHEEIDQLTPAYAITIHKSQGNEYPVVIIPVDMQHKYLLHKNLLYTAITRGKKLCILLGTRKAIEFTIQSTENLMVTHRFTGLVAWMRGAISAQSDGKHSYTALSAAEEAEAAARDNEQPLPRLSNVRKRYVQAKKE